MEAEKHGLSAWLPALLQAADPLFPTGAYAHSFGLEEMVRLGVVKHEADLTHFLTDHLLPQLENAEMPYLRFSITAASRLSDLIAIDHEISAWKVAAETRSSSTQIGTRRINALSISHQHPLLEGFRAAIENGETPGHHLSACAVQAAIIHTPIEAALLTYGYQSLAGACTAALKLIRIGQEGCQRAIASALSRLPLSVEGSLHVRREEAGSFSPMLEIAAMRHAYANERLFIS